MRSDKNGFHIIIDACKVLNMEGFTRFSDRPFGFMQLNGNSLRKFTVEEAMDFFYNNVFTSLGFTPEVDKDMNVSWVVMNGLDEPVTLMPDDRLTINLDNESVRIDFLSNSTASPDSVLLFYGDVQQQFKNYVTVMVRHATASLPAVIPEELWGQYRKGAGDRPVKEYVREAIEERGYVCYDYGSAFIVYTEHDDKTRTEVILDKMKKDKRYEK